MNEYNEFEISKGKLRQLSPEEEAYINGTAAPAAKQQVQDSSSEELAAGARRVVPDGAGGFKPVSAITTAAPVLKEVPAEPDTATVIRIPKASKRVTIKCAGAFGDEGRTGMFTVGIDALSVEVEDDGVSILMRSDIDVRPPSLATMTVEVEGVGYSVIYAGGKHRLGNYISMSFTRV